MIIFIDGMSTTGKTSIINKLSRLLESEKECHIFFENDTNHMMREHLDKYKRININFTEEDYFAFLIKAWKEILIKCTGDIYYIFDGYILHELERTFLCNQFSWNNVKKYYDTLNQLLSEFNCFLIFLDRENICESIFNTFNYRNIKWRTYKIWQLEHIAKFNYLDSSDIIAAINYTQNKMYYLYEKLTITKQKLNTSDENWDVLVEGITSNIKNKYENEDKERKI